MTTWKVLGYWPHGLWLAQIPMAYGWPKHVRAQCQCHCHCHWPLLSWALSAEPNMYIWHFIDFPEIRRSSQSPARMACGVAVFGQSIACAWHRNLCTDLSRIAWHRNICNRFVGNIEDCWHRKLCTDLSRIFSIKAVYGISANWEGGDLANLWRFWVGRPKSGFALNVLAGVRIMQLASKS